MAENRFLKSAPPHRSRLFEFLLVMVAVSVLIHVASLYLRRVSEDAPSQVLEFNAGVFSRMVTNLQAVGAVTREPFVSLNATVFFLNENGWPANTDAAKSPSLDDQTAEECEEVWQGVFANAANSELIDKTYKKSDDYAVSLNKKSICRYSLSGKQEGSLFIDYDVSTGAVTVLRPSDNDG